MDNRPRLDEYFMAMARVVQTRASCARRQVGCVLVDVHGHVLSTGYNGPPPGVSNCTEHACGGAEASSGEALDCCQAIHAEQNALLQCPDTARIWACYSTTSPCVHCVKLLANTGCTRIVYDEAYGNAFDAATFWIAVLRARASQHGWNDHVNITTTVTRLMGERLGYPATMHAAQRWSSRFPPPSFGPLHDCKKV